MSSRTSAAQSNFTHAVSASYRSPWANSIGAISEAFARSGGDPAPLLARYDLTKRELAIEPPQRPSFTVFQSLLNEAARELGRPDFGLFLAQCQARTSLTGALAIAMLHCETVGEAFQFCSEHLYTFANETMLTLRRDVERGWLQLNVDIAQEAIDGRQAVEQAVLRTHLMAKSLSGGQIKPIQIWFQHEHMASQAEYLKYFGISPLFSQTNNAVLIKLEDADFLIPNRNPDIYNLARTFIAMCYDKPDESLATRVRRILRSAESVSSVTTNQVADLLGMHSRTFQRRLRDEDARFDQIKDEICREIAWHLLRFSRLPMIGIANHLGYSEPSTLSRRCQAWFSASPKQIRRDAA